LAFNQNRRNGTIMLDNVIDTTENCRYCLMCRHVAPIGHVTSNETLTPHGIALTVASQRRGLIDWTPETISIIYSEPDAGNNRAHCITDQPLPAAIAAVRAQLVDEKLAPDVIYSVHADLQKWNTPFAEKEITPTAETGEVALLLSDEATYLWDNIEDDVTKLLDAVDIKPAIIGRGRSTGYLASSLGFPQTAIDQATRLLDELATTGAETLIVLSPGDFFTINQLYQERLGVSLPEDIKLVCLTDLLADNMVEGKLAFSKSDNSEIYAYLDATHAVRVPQSFDAPRQLLDTLMDSDCKELFWRKDRAHPVGSTALQFTQPQLADQLTHARLQDAKNSGAKIIFCEDPASLHQLARFADDYQLQVKGLYAYLVQYLI
jgi:Fe-S oxidoreductase